MVKDMLDRISAEYNFSVSIIDRNTPEGQEIALQAGVLFPPSIKIPGKPFSYGRPFEKSLDGNLNDIR